MIKTNYSQILARGSFRIRILTVLVPKYLPLVFRPHAPIFYRVLIGRAVAFAQETDVDGVGRCGTGTGGVIGNRENRGGELDEKDKEGDG